MFRKTLWFIPAAAVLVAGGISLAMAGKPPAGLDYSRSHASNGGHYLVTVTPGIDPIPVGKMHEWTVAVTGPNGRPAKAEIEFDGGMPQHGHGLPSVPRVTGQDASGRKVVSGVRFNMPGWWRIEVKINGAAGADTAVFNLAL